MFVDQNLNRLNRHRVLHVFVGVVLMSIAVGPLASCDLFGQTRLPKQGRQNDQRKINELIYALDEAASLSERKQIYAKLISFNQQTLEALRNPPTGLSQQTKLLLAQVKSELEKRNNARLVQATPFSLTGEFSLESALDSISKQTGAVFQLGKDQVNLNLSQTKKFTLNSIGFWRGLDQVLDAFELDVVSMSKPKGLKVIRSNRKFMRAENAFYGKGVRAEVIRQPALHRATGSRSATLKSTIRFQWEPTMSPYLLEFDYETVRARQKNGKDLPASKTDRLKYSITPSQGFVDLQIPVQLETPDVRSIDSVSGQLTLTVPVGRHSFTFSDWTRKKQTPKRKADAEVRIQSTSSEDSLFQIDLLLALNRAGKAFDSHQGWMFQNRAYLLDRNDVKILPKKLLTTLQEKDKMGFSFQFELPNGPAGHQFIYETPTSIRKVPIKFDLKLNRTK